MKNLMLLFITLLFCSQCSSQEKQQNQQPKLETLPNQTVDENYFVGSWSLAKTYYTSENVKKLPTQRECAKNSYWKFSMENGILKQSKFTAKGKDCSQYISTNYGTVTIKNNVMSYFVSDVLYAVKIQINSPTEFALLTKDFIGGKMVSIEEIYTKK